MSFVLFTQRDVQNAENDAAILPEMIGLMKLTSKIHPTRVIVDSKGRLSKQQSIFVAKTSGLLERHTIKKMIRRFPVCGSTRRYF